MFFRFTNRALLASILTAGVIAFFGHAPVCAQDAPAAEKKEQEPKTKIDAEALKTLIGTWKAVRLVGNGQEAPEQIVESMSMTFSKDGLIVTGNTGPDDEAECEFRLNGSTDPKQFDFMPQGAPDFLLGIYKIEDGKLIMALVRPGQGDRPTEFTSEEGSEQLLGEFKKVEEEKGDK